MGCRKSGCLALILLLDQMTRNIYRDTPKAFAGDEIALALSLRAVAQKWVENEEIEANGNFPHANDAFRRYYIQEKSLPLFSNYTSARTYDYAVRHRDIVARFGHFPHQNVILGRPSSTER